MRYFFSLILNARDERYNGEDLVICYPLSHKDILVFSYTFVLLSVGDFAFR